MDGTTDTVCFCAPWPLGPIPFIIVQATCPFLPWGIVHFSALHTGPFVVWTAVPDLWLKTGPNFGTPQSRSEVQSRLFRCSGAVGFGFSAA